MKNNWSNSQALKYIKHYKKLGHSKDMALRVYTTRLLGRNPELVLHGGGNTSVKTTIRDVDGKNYKVLCVIFGIGSSFHNGDHPLSQYQI